MAPEPVGALRGILGDVEERRAVRGPGDRRDLLDALGEELAGREVLDVERVLAGAGDVHRVGQEPTVVAHRVGANREERVACGERVQVERHRLGGLDAPLPAAIDRVLPSLLGA